MTLLQQGNRFGRVQDDISTKPKLSFGIADTKNPIMHGEEQKITLTISHDGSTIEEAIIKATVINKDNIPIYRVPGFTNSSGQFTHSWKIEADKYFRRNIYYKTRCISRRLSK